MHQLTIPEFFVLLSIDENTQSIEAPVQSNIETYTGIGIFLELYIKKHIRIDNEFIIHRQNSVSPIPYLQTVLELTRDSDNNQDVNEWLIKINKYSRVLYDSVLSQLNRHQKLKITERRILGFTFQKKYQCFQNRKDMLDFLQKTAMTDKSSYLATVSLLYVMKCNGLLRKEVNECFIQLEEQDIYQLDLQGLQRIIEEIQKTILSLLIAKHQPFMGGM